MADNDVQPRGSAWHFIWAPAYMLAIILLADLPYRSGLDPGVWLGPVLQNALHIPLYAALAWLWKLAAARLPLRNLTANGLIVLVCVSYAAFDEWYQLSIPGRDASVFDVLLDGIGIIIGIWFYDRYTVIRGES